MDTPVADPRLSPLYKEPKIQCTGLGAFQAVRTYSGRNINVVISSEASGAELVEPRGDDEIVQNRSEPCD